MGSDWPLAASTRQTDTRDIWVMDLARGVSSRFTFDKADDLNPVWSPDGSRIAFTSDRNGQRDIYWKAAGGASAEELVLETKEAKSLEDWSADGKFLLFNVDTSSVHAAPTSGDRKPFPTLASSFRSGSRPSFPRRPVDRLRLERVRQAGSLRAKLSSVRWQVAGLPKWRNRAGLASRRQGVVLHERQQAMCG